MIIEHIVNGTRETTLHSFKILINNVDIITTKGFYYRAGNIIFQIDNDISITFPITNELTHYEIWITETGIQVLSRKENEVFDVVDNPIDRLVWFSVPANESNLNNVDVHFVKVVE